MLGQIPSIGNICCTAVLQSLLTCILLSVCSVCLCAASEGLPAQDGQGQQKESDGDAQDAVLDGVREWHVQLSSCRQQLYLGWIVHQRRYESLPPCGLNIPLQYRKTHHVKTKPFGGGFLDSPLAMEVPP